MLAAITSPTSSPLEYIAIARPTLVGNQACARLGIAGCATAIPRASTTVNPKSISGLGSAPRNAAPSATRARPTATARRAPTRLTR